MCTMPHAYKVCCIVLRCIAVCCSVLQCVAVRVRTSSLIQMCAMPHSHVKIQDILTNIPAYIHACAFIHACVHSRIHTYMRIHAYMQTCRRTNIQTHMHPYIYTPILFLCKSFVFLGYHVPQKDGRKGGQKKQKVPKYSRNEKYEQE